MMKNSRKAKLFFKISEFEVPPMQDLLVIGKKAPVGPEAARRMAEAVSPDQFTILRIDHPKVEAVLIKKSLIEQLDQEVLLQTILEEADHLLDDTMVLRSELRVSLTVEREVEW
jgi:hypothetical protein